MKFRERAVAPHLFEDLPGERLRVGADCLDEAEDALPLGVELVGGRRLLLVVLLDEARDRRRLGVLLFFMVGWEVVFPRAIVEERDGVASILNVGGGFDVSRKVVEDETAVFHRQAVPFLQSLAAVDLLTVHGPELSEEFVFMLRRRNGIAKPSEEGDGLFNIVVHRLCSLEGEVSHLLSVGSRGCFYLLGGGFFDCRLLPFAEVADDELVALADGRVFRGGGYEMRIAELRGLLALGDSDRKDGTSGAVLELNHFDKRFVDF